jgi:hypothetical protein
MSKTNEFDELLENLPNMNLKQLRSRLMLEELKINRSDYFTISRLEEEIEQRINDIEQAAENFEREADLFEDRSYAFEQAALQFPERAPELQAMAREIRETSRRNNEMALELRESAMPEESRRLITPGFTAFSERRETEEVRDEPEPAPQNSPRNSD